MADQGRGGSALARFLKVFLLLAVVFTLCVLLVRATAQKAGESEHGDVTPATKRRDWPTLQLDARNALGTAISVVGSSLAVAAGVGGGGLFVPMFDLVLGFDMKIATALSQAMILGGAVLGFFFNVRLRHPHQARPLIDYNIALLLMPMMLLGTGTGVLLNVLLPSWLIVFLLTWLLSYMTYTTLGKGIVLHRVEAARAAERAEARIVGQQELDELDEKGAHDYEDPSHSNLAGLSKGSSSAPSSPKAFLLDPAACMGRAKTDNTPARGFIRLERGPDMRRWWSSNALVSMAIEPDPSLVMQYTSLREDELVPAAVMEDSVPFPTLRLAEAGIIWLVFLIFAFLRGGRNAESVVGIQNCSPAYWTLLLLQVPVAIGCTGFVAWRLLHERKASEAEALTRPARGSQGDLGEVTYYRRELLLYPCFALGAGIMGGLLGIGGGMIIGPLLLELGVIAEVTSATSAFMVLMSSSLATGQFIILKLLPWDWATYYGLLCAAAGFVGLSTVRYLVAKSGKASIIIFALASFLGISAVVVAIIGVKKVVHQIETGTYMGMESLC